MQLRFEHFHFFFCIIVAVEFQEKWPGNLCVLLQSGNREIFKGLKKLEIKDRQYYTRVCEQLSVG